MGRFFGGGGGLFRALFRSRLRFFRSLGRQIRHVQTVEAAQPDGHVLIDGAGVRLLFGDAEFGEALQYFVGLDFQLPRQLVDPNLLHRQNNLL